MKKLRFKNRGGILYFGIDGNFKSSRLKYTNVNKNILIGKFRSGQLDSDLDISSRYNVPTVVELLKEVLDNKKKSLKHKTILSYSVSCTTKIIPFFQDKLVTEIKPIDIKRFQDSLIDKGLGKGTINVARILLKQVFNLAILSEHVTMNPIKMVDMPQFRQEKKRQKPFTLDEIDLILSNTNGAIRNFLGIAFFTGARSGEILALKWEDVDFVTDTLSINKTIAEGYLNSPKTASSYRDIEILPMAKEFLKAQRLETGLKDSFVFLNKKNSYYGSNTHFYNRFQMLLEKLELPQRSLHNTRHTFASMMLNNGIEPLWVSNTLGHENLDITLKIYTHFMPKKEKMVIGFLEKRYKNGTMHT